jgi:PIN domain nuclease of toxin-antitoxin system
MPTMTSIWKTLKSTCDESALDTHTLLWFALGDPQISVTALAAIQAQENAKFVSPASYWEVAIKLRIGKFSLNESFETFMQRAIGGNGFSVMPIEVHHTAVLTTLPFHHRDPFDRLLVAQALTEQLAIVSGDPLLDPYGIQRIW